VQKIQNLYAAFGRGDVPTILSYLGEDVEWDNSRVASRECPWNGNFSGRTHVPGFFRALSEHLDFKTFEPRTFIDSGDAVAVLLQWTATVRKNGRSAGGDSVHVWRFNEHGQVGSYRHFNDTAMELAAWRD
jgi:ketosteroid isomerase-like protein